MTLPDNNRTLERSGETDLLVSSSEDIILKTWNIWSLVVKHYYLANRKSFYAIKLTVKYFSNALWTVKCN